MLVRPSTGDKKAAAERRRARNRQLLREHRERERRGLAVYHVIIDSAMLDLLIAEGFLADAQVTDKAMVSAALGRYLWAKSH